MKPSSLIVVSKCLAILYLPITLPKALPMSAAPDNRAGLRPSFDGPQQFLGRGQQLCAFAGTLGGQQRVAARDQPFAGVVGMGDLGQILLVEQAHLQWAVIGGQCGDRGVRSAVIHPKSASAVSLSSRSALIRAVVIMPRSPTITRSSEFEAVFHRPVTISVNAAGSAVLPANTRTATGRPSGHRATRIRSAAALLSVAGVPAGGQLAVLPGHPRARTGRTTPSGPGSPTRGSRCLAASFFSIAVLAADQPVHRRVDLVGGRVGDPQVDAQGGVGPPEPG